MQAYVGITRGQKLGMDAIVPTCKGGRTEGDAECRTAKVTDRSDKAATSFSDSFCFIYTLWKVFRIAYRQKSYGCNGNAELRLHQIFAERNRTVWLWLHHQKPNQLDCPIDASEKSKVSSTPPRDDMWESWISADST